MSLPPFFVAGLRMPPRKLCFGLVSGFRVCEGVPDHAQNKRYVVTRKTWKTVFKLVTICPAKLTVWESVSTLRLGNDASSAEGVTLLTGASGP